MKAGQWGKKAADLMEEDRDSLDKEWIRNIWVSYTNPTGLLNKNVQRKNVNIFLPISFNICFGFF